MARRYCFLFLFAPVAILRVHADLNFTIRYHDKKIYYPGDRVELHLTLSNPGKPGATDESFYLADDPRQSFGFDLRSLTGDPTPLAEGYVGALNEKGAYRIVHLAPGQELSLTVALNDWVDLTTAEQYRLTGFFYPRLRGRQMYATQAESVLDLTVMPDMGRRWQDQMSVEVRNALINRDMDPWNVVRETFESRSDSKFNRAMLYLDTESLAGISPSITDADELGRSLIKGDWRDLPGFEYPAVDWELLSSEVYPFEATVRLIAAYEPQGERFERDLRFYLHKKDGYWSIRRIESVERADADPQHYGTLNLDPPEVVAELIRSVTRGDWDIALRYYDINDSVRNLPEYSERWKDMSSTEHGLALSEYRERLISGRLEEAKKPLADLEEWRINGVNYSGATGSVVVENTKTHTTAEGPLGQKTIYTFRLEKTGGTDDRWIVIRYDTVRVGD